MKNSLHGFLFSFLLTHRASFLLFLLLLGQFPAVMGGKISSPGAAAVIGEDIQKLPLATVICCNPPVAHTTDTYIPSHIFLNLAAFLEENVQELRWRWTTMSLFLYSTAH